MKYLLILLSFFIITAEAKTPTSFTVKINGKNLTEVEYKTKKTNLVGKVKNKNKLTQKDVKEWIEIASLEIKDCPFALKKGDDVVAIINGIMETGCK